MPNLENAAPRSSASGDGQSSLKTVPHATVNSNFKPARRGERINLSVKEEKKPVSVSYSKRTTTQIVDDQFNQADEHSRKISSSRETAYLIIEVLKFALVAAMSWGGGTFAANWTPGPGVEVLPGIKFASVILFAIGPWFAYALSYFLKIGVFSGISKKIAWAIIAAVIIEEALALKAMRDTDFANWIMTELAPYSLAAMLIGIVSLTYLRSDLKRKRDLAEMKASEEDMLAKNATDARMMKATAERRSRTLLKMGGLFSHIGVVVFGFAASIICGIIRGAAHGIKGSWDAALPDVAKAPKKTTQRKAKK